MATASKLNKELQEGTSIYIRHLQAKFSSVLYVDEFQQKLFQEWCGSPGEVEFEQ